MQITLTPEASRAARALLAWSIRDLMREANVSPNTVTSLEGGKAIKADTVAKITAAFEAHGVELVADDDRTGAVLVYAKRKADADQDGKA